MDLDKNKRKRKGEEIKVWREREQR